MREGSGPLSPTGRTGGRRAWSHKTTIFLLVVGGLAVVLVLVIVAVGFGRRPGGLKSPLSILPVSQKKSSTPQLTEKYQNPFERETQYVNPFQEFKSPFQSLQQ